MTRLTLRSHEYPVDDEPVNFVVNDFKVSMRLLAATVTVITSIHEERRSGLTATATCSLSMDPASMIVCVNRNAHTHDYIANSGLFCVNLLTEGQRELAEVFAGATGKEGEAKFAASGAWHTYDGGAPMLEDSLSSIDCRVLSRTEMGTHSIFIGLVRRVRTAPSKRPLIYADRKFVGVGSAA